jgi:hypothetical protein
MILECYQCSSCYFEDKRASSRIDAHTISPSQPRIEFENVVLGFICVEMHDSREEVKEVADEFNKLLAMLGRRPVVICPNVHMSLDKAPEKQAVFLLSELKTLLTEAGIDAHFVSFGYHKQFGMECNGNVGSVIGRRFYGSPERQFLRLLTRLGVCPHDALPGELPAWAKVLSRRQLKVMSNRKETYRVAKQMLKGQLDTGNSELWTCMLFEGERQPMDDYLSELYEIIQSYPDVRIHRAMNLSIPGFANAARFLFRKYPEVLESGKMRIYNSTVSDIEFLLTPCEVLLAFPQKPRRAGSHAGEISFGIYCKDADFARNVIQWYRTFLVDGRFGWVRTESALTEVINELEEEIFQDRFQ